MRPQLSKSTISLKSIILCLVLLFTPWFGITSPAGVEDGNGPGINPGEIELEFNSALQPWKGDYDGMVQRKMIRLLVPYSRTHFFLDGATERGILAAMGRELEQEVNRREGLRTRMVRVVFIPVKRSQLIPWLNEGLGDIGAGSLAITENRRLAADFTDPLFRNTAEVVVTGPRSPPIDKMEDLAGRVVSVQGSSSYHHALEELNQRFLAKGLPPMTIELLDEVLEVDEILEMVHVGIIPITVAERETAQFWSGAFTDLKVHDDLAVTANRDIGWAFRKNSPKLREVLNEFLEPRRHRTAFGNIMIRRYMQDAGRVKNPVVSDDRARFDRAIPYFHAYGEKYDLDPLLLAGLGYQESRLDQGARSPAGAIGIMQLLPATATFLDVGDITQMEPNIHAGTKYLRYLIDNRVNLVEIDRVNQVLFGLASYNGGHTRIRRLRREAADIGLDPNLWFHNVELVAARVIGRETVSYVRNIYMYHLTFQKIEERRARRASRAQERQP